MTSAPQLIAAIEVSAYEFFGAYGRGDQGELWDEPGLLRFFTGIPSPVFNGVLRTQFPPDQVEARIEETLSYFKAREMPLVWWVGPSTRPADLGQRLEAHGGTHALDLPGMAVDLQSLNEDLPPPSRLVIEPVTDTATLRQYIEIAALIFDMPEFPPRGWADAWFDLEASLSRGSGLPWRRYIGRLEGEPVAISMLALAEKVACIDLVSTLPEVRRQGIGTAMTVAPLLEARAMGYRWAVLYSSPEACGIYRRLGFQEYCKSSLYVWAG